MRRDFEPDSARFTFTMSMHRNAFGDADDQRNLRIDGFENGIGRKGRRHIDDGGISAGFLAGFQHGVKTGKTDMRRATLAGRHAAHHLGAIGNRLLGVEGAVVAGDALADDLGVLVDENGHQAASFTALTIFLAASSRSSAGDDVEPGVADDLLAEFDIGAFEAHHQRNLEAHFLHRGDHAFGDDVAFHDAAEDVDQDALHARVGGDDLEGGRHLFLRGAAADIEEVGGLGAVELDDVHGGHGKARAIHHAADGAIERHIGEIDISRLRFPWGLLRSDRAGLDVGMAVERVVVEIHLGIEAERAGRPWSPPAD